MEKAIPILSRKKHEVRDTRKIETLKGVSLLISGVILSVVIFVFSMFFRSEPVVQTILILLSMGLLFYSSHPLAHYLVARLFKTKVEYFFVGRSDFRRLKPLKKIGGAMPTIGTKLESSSYLKALSPLKKGVIFGSGAIVSTILIAIEYVYAFVSERFSFFALVLSGLLIVGTVASELLLGTKVGDLAKMRKKMSSVPQ
jgi:hypothetical protein